MIDFFRAVPKSRKIKIKKGKGILFANLSTEKKIVFHFGNIVFICALIGLVYLYFPLFKTVTIYEATKNNKTNVSEVVSKIENIKTKDFLVEIPKIGAVSKVVIGVDPFDKNDYKKVIDGNLVAQSKISSLPGEGIGTMSYLFAHSTQQGVEMVRKNSVFYLLGQLQKDDKIFVKNGGDIFEYSVFKQVVVSPKEVNYLTYRESDKELLLLQTCWPIGTDWKRLIIFAQRIK